MRLGPGYVICACAWHGELGAKTPCPSCGRPAIDRVDTLRARTLVAVQGDRGAFIPQTMRQRLMQMQVIRYDGRKGKTRTRLHSLTASGHTVVAVYQSLEQERELRRAIVAESVARHATLDDQEHYAGPADSIDPA